MSEGAVPTPLDRADTFAGRSVEVLRGMILDGSLPAGDRLNEVQLSTSLGISRGPLREAIQRLASEGLVEMVTHRGSFVRSFTPGELTDLYELRIALEKHAVRLVAERGLPADLAPLTAMLGATDQLMADDEQKAYPSELDFHAQLVGLAGNEPILRAAVRVGQQIQMARARSARQPERARDALREHHEILDAIAAGDGETAATLMHEHLRRSLDSALAVLGSGGASGR